MSEADRNTLESLVQNLTTAEMRELINQLNRSLQHVNPANLVAKQRQAYHELRAKLAELPVENPPDGFSNRDHDQVLYGERK